LSQHAEIRQVGKGKQRRTRDAARLQKLFGLSQNLPRIEEKVGPARVTLLRGGISEKKENEIKHAATKKVSKAASSRT